MLGHHPGFAEQNKVDIRSDLLARGRGQHGEDRRVGMVEQNCANGRIGAQVIFVGAAGPVSDDDIQWAAPSRSRETGHTN